MTDITKLALIAKIKKQLENFDTVVLKAAEAYALVEALEKSDSRLHEVAVACATAEQALEKAQRAQPCEHSMFWDASGVKRCSKCDMPEHANVHYADAAEMEIAALRQRIAELESRTVKLPPCVDDLHGIGMVMSADAVVEALTSYGIKVEDE